MSLKQQLQQRVLEALKTKEEVSLVVLRMALASITSKEKEKRYKLSLGHSLTGEAKEKPELQDEELNKQSELTDDEVMSTLSSEIKKRKDAIVLYEKGNRSELVQKEQGEIAILQKFLPKQLSSEELRFLVQTAIQKVGAKEMKDMGKVMAELAPRIKGKADGGEVSKIVKELLTQ